jgi:hypothetical protein
MEGNATHMRKAKFYAEIGPTLCIRMIFILKKQYTVLWHVDFIQIGSSG